MTSLIGFSQALVDGSLRSDSERTRAATIVNEEAQRLLRLAQELLDLARVESGQIALQTQPVDLLRRLVEINSGTKNLEGVRAVGKALMPEFEALGFKVQWVSMDEVQRAGTLVAEHACPDSGKCGKRVLLIGHMDTVFEKDSPFQHFALLGPRGGADDSEGSGLRSTAARPGDWASGPGTNDMKGGLVVMIAALKALKTA